MKNKKLYDLLTSSKRILLTSHFSADQDSLGSTLFTYNILKENLKDKDYGISIEGKIPSIDSFLEGFSEIKNELLIDTINTFKPDLLIMFDGSSYDRFSKNEYQKVMEIVKEKGIKTVCIDHHVEIGKDEFDVYVNNGRSSASEEVYFVFVKDFGFKTYPKNEESVLFGIIGDTGRFMYRNEKYRDTFEVVSEFLDHGLSIEKLQSKIDVFSMPKIKIIGELLKNIKQKDDYNYSFLSDEFFNSLIADGIGADDYALAYHFFMDAYIRSVYPNKWGFIIVPDIASPKGNYKGSFRAVNDCIDTTVFARKMEGGGHKAASGFKLKANSCIEAIDIVHKIINENREEAVI